MRRMAAAKGKGRKGVSLRGLLVLYGTKERGFASER